MSAELSQHTDLHECSTAGIDLPVADHMREGGTRRVAATWRSPVSQNLKTVYQISIPSARSAKAMNREARDTNEER